MSRASQFAFGTNSACVFLNVPSRELELVAGDPVPGEAVTLLLAGGGAHRHLSLLISAS